MHPQSITLSLPTPTPTSHTLSTLHSTYRQGGIRLQQQQVNNKHIYHNYGQGQSEFSLAYGSAYIVSKMITLKKEDYKTKDVAVVGDGINALLTTLELGKRGHKVTLYSSRMPVEKAANGDKRIPSGQGLQFWYPAFYDNSDPLKHQLLSKLSFEFLQNCMASNRYQSLKPVSLYTLGPISQELSENVTDFITKDIHPVTISFSNMQTEPAIHFRTILINTQLFIEELYTELKLRNVNIVVKKFGSMKDLLLLNQDFIYHCVGELGDQVCRQVENFNVTLHGNFSESHPIKGVNNSNKEDVILWVSSELEGEEDYVIYITKDRIQISSKNRESKDYNKNIPKTSQRLLAKTYHFFKERTTQLSKL